MNLQARLCRLSLANKTQLCSEGCCGLFALPWSLPWGCWSLHTGPGQRRRCPRARLLREMVPAALSKPGAGWSRWDLWREHYSVQITTNFLADVVAGGTVKMSKIILSGCFSPWAPWFAAEGKGGWELHRQQAWGILSCFKHKFRSSSDSVMCLLLKKLMFKKSFETFSQKDLVLSGRIKLCIYMYVVIIT